MKVVTIVGARPQFIKAGRLSAALDSAGVGETLVHTGQHFDHNMSEVFFEQLRIKRPDVNLGIGGGMHGQMTGRQLAAIEEVLLERKPDWVVVFGDTNSTLAGALAAAKLHIPIAHVEAGLRSFNRRMPEEINRVVADHVSDTLFSPTRIATRNLEREGFEPGKICQVGDIMLDATLHYKSMASAPEGVSTQALSNGFVLSTIHRAENTDDPDRLANILRGLSSSPLPIVLPLHPRTKKSMDEQGISFPDNFVVIPPVGYLEMNWLEANASAIATDSGGVQKEAFFHGKFCVTLRDETEWVELVERGVNKLVGADARLIADALQAKCDVEFTTELYGDGTCASQIVQRLLEEL